MAAVNQRSSAADDMTELATQAIKVAEEEKRRAEENFQLAERQKREHKAALEEVEFLREKARIEFKTAKRMKKEAKEMNSQMNDAVEAQKAAVDAVTKNASAEKLALMKAAEEAKYAALHQAEQKRRSDKALQKAIAKVSPESSPDHSPLRRKKHAKSIATTHAETVVGGAAVLKIVDQKKAADIALARAEDAIAVALMNRADDGDRFEAFAETLNATNTKAHEEIVLRQMAEERAEELERKILELKEELTAAMEYKKHWQKSEQRIKDEQKGFEKVLYEERAVKFDALEKLRGAMKAREKIAELNKEQTDHAMGIAASKIDPKRIGTDDAPSQPLANVGIVIGTKLSAATAAMAGFGAGGGNMHEPVVLSIALSKDGEGHASRAAAVAVCLDTEKWIIKWVVDPPKGQKAQQMLMGADGPFGEQSVRISTVKEGFLLYHGSVVVQPRPDAIKLTKRYTWAVMSRIAVKLQARLRTKKVLVEKAKAALKVKQGLLSVRISGVIRGFLARREARRRRARPDRDAAAGLHTRKARADEEAADEDGRARMGRRPRHRDAEGAHLPRELGRRVEEGWRGAARCARPHPRHVSSARQRQGQRCRACPHPAREGKEHKAVGMAHRQQGWIEVSVARDRCGRREKGGQEGALITVESAK